MERNYFYKILGISPNATEKEIDEGFHRVIKIYHPDSGATNDEMVKDILHAYNVLSDEEKRKAYDRAQETGGEPEGEHRFRSQSGFSDVARQEYRGSSDWIQRDYDSKERREMIHRLSEAEHSSNEIVNMLQYASSLFPKKKKKRGWILFGLSSIVDAFFFMIWPSGPWTPWFWSWVMENLLNPKFIEDRILVLILYIIWPIINILWFIWKIKRNRKIAEYNAGEVKRTEMEREKVIAQAGELLKMEEKTLAVLPKRFQYAKAFKGIRELIEDGRADSMKEAINLYEQTKYQEDVVAGIKAVSEQLSIISDNLRNMKVDVTVW